VDCDDGNACTNNSCEAATGECTAGPVGCADGDACTVDTCDAAQGTCAYPPVPLNEVTPVDFSSPTTLGWPATLGATHWNAYRGSIPQNMLGSRLPGPVYDHVCFESGDAALDGATVATDASIPPLGTGWYYDITEEGGCGEGPFGTASSGVMRPNPAPCPTPP
jgi:hypothetical protein